MADLINVPLRDIEPNPFRRLGDYPYVEQKLEALQRSYKDVGMWEGVIGRKRGNKIELAFAHHRVEAARRADMKTITVILRDLTDIEMLQFMGRENLEDYNADFQCMLETWEAAVKFQHAEKKTKPVETARLLGWTYMQGKHDVMNPTARACNAALSLLRGGYISRDQLGGLTVRSAEDICVRAQSRMDRLEVVGRERHEPAEKVERAKKQVGKAVADTAKQVREGDVKAKDVRQRVDTNTYINAHQSKEREPLLLIVAMEAMTKQINKMLVDDANGTKIKQLARELPSILSDMDGADRMVLGELRDALDRLASRAEGHSKRLDKASQRPAPTVTKLKEISNG